MGEHPWLDDEVCWTSVLDPLPVQPPLCCLVPRPGCWGFVCSFMCCSSLSSFCFLFSLLLPVSIHCCSHPNSQWRNQNSVLVLLERHQDFLQRRVYYRRRWNQIKSQRNVCVILLHLLLLVTAVYLQTGGGAATCRWPSTAAQHSGVWDTF